MSDLTVPAAHSNLQPLPPTTDSTLPGLIEGRSQTTTISGGTQTTKIVDPARDTVVQMLRHQEEERTKRDLEIKQAIQTVAHGIVGTQGGGAADRIAKAVSDNFHQVGGVDGSEQTGLGIVDKFLGDNRTFLTDVQADRFIKQFQDNWRTGMFGAKGDRHHQRGLENPDVNLLQDMLTGVLSEIKNSPEFLTAQSAVKAGQMLLDYDKGVQQGQSTIDANSLLKQLIDPPNFSQQSSASNVYDDNSGNKSATLYDQNPNVKVAIDIRNTPTPVRIDINSAPVRFDNKRMYA